MSNILQRAELQGQIWKIANDVRGSIDGWDFKQYVLGTLYYRFISENFASGQDGVEAVYVDEDVWLSQKMMSVLYDVETNTINNHLKNIFSDNELKESAVIRNFRITAKDSKSYSTQHYEKYRIVEDRLFESDFDRAVKKIEASQKKGSEG